MVIAKSAECSARPKKTEKGRGQIEERTYLHHTCKCINYTEQLKLVGRVIRGQQVSAQLWARWILEEKEKREAQKLKKIG